MKDKIISTLIVIIFAVSIMLNIILGLFVINNHTITTNLYAIDAKVIKADDATKTVTFQDKKGHFWQINKMENFSNNNECIIIFDNWGTVEKIEDDKIVKIVKK